MSTKGKKTQLRPHTKLPKSKSEPKRSLAKQVKTKPGKFESVKKRKTQKMYTDKELGLPALNMVTPVGVEKPRGKKKGKTFVDDPESMMTILAMVNAEKEGQIESKMIKARQMEEIRDAKRREAEAKEENRKRKFEEKKNEVKRSRHSKAKSSNFNGVTGELKQRSIPQTPKKNVSFA